MLRRDRSLLDQIERDALDGSTKLADALRKCMALAGRVGSRELREWASRELRGYERSEQRLPEYRVVVAPIHIDGGVPGAVVSHQRISPGQLSSPVNEEIGERVELRHPIGQLEALARQGEAVKMSLPMGADIVRLMNYELRDRFQVRISLQSDQPFRSFRNTLTEPLTTTA